MTRKELTVGDLAVLILTRPKNELTQVAGLSHRRDLSRLRRRVRPLLEEDHLQGKGPGAPNENVEIQGGHFFIA